MNILQVLIFDTKSCGPTSVMMQIIPRLSKYHNIDIFSVKGYSRDKKDFANKIGANYFHTNGELILTEKQIIKYIPNFYSYDIVHIHGIYEFNHYKIAKLLKKNNIPYVVSIHGNLMKSALLKSRYKKKIVINLCVKNMLINSSGIHVMAKNELIDVRNLIKNHQYYLIFNGVEQLESNIIKNINDKFLNLLFVGRLDVNQKGLDLLIEAVAKNVDKFKGSLHIFIVGPFNTKNDQRIIMSKLQSRPDLCKIISIEGPKYEDDKKKYYQKCDVFIHTSRYEGMPVAVLEAMEMAMPCILTPGTNMAEIIEECNGGVIVQQNIDSIASGIEYLTSLNRDEIFKMGKNAKKWSEENLNWDQISDDYLKMYCDVLNNNINSEQHEY